MIIPRLMLITHRISMQPNFAAALESALSGGAPWIQVRESEQTFLQVLADAKIARELCARYDAILSVNGAHEMQSDCVHWPQRFLEMAHSRAPKLNGYSVHDLASAQLAAQSGADYLLFGHVFPTQSHAEKAAGLAALGEICARVEIPVLAIGGVKSENIGACLEVGAHGVAIMRSVWHGDVQSHVCKYLRMLS